MILELKRNQKRVLRAIVYSRIAQLDIMTSGDAIYIDPINTAELLKEREILKPILEELETDEP